MKSAKDIEYDIEFYERSLEGDKKAIKIINQEVRGYKKLIRLLKIQLKKRKEINNAKNRKRH